MTLGGHDSTHDTPRGGDAPNFRAHERELTSHLQTDPLGGGVGTRVPPVMQASPLSLGSLE